MIPIRVRDSQKLSETHADNILKYYQVYYLGRPLAEINTWIKTNLDTNLSFSIILKADPTQLASIAERYQSMRTKLPFTSAINGIKRQYERFRTSSVSPFRTRDNKPYDGHVFADNLGLSVCPYCNRNYIFNIPKSKRTTCEFDHFYDQAAFPFFALSFYNLIPSCKTCNHLKSNLAVGFYNLHRGDITEKELVRFSCMINGVAFLDNIKDLTLKYQIHPAYQQTFNKLKIEELYSKHLDLVQEVLQKRLIYNNDYIDQLYAEYGGRVFNSREHLVNLLLSNYIQDSEIHLRPFAKLVKHVWEQLDYLTY